MRKELETGHCRESFLAIVWHECAWRAMLDCRATDGGDWDADMRQAIDATHWIEFKY